MPLPLFDGVVVSPAPVQERPPRNAEREEFERDRFGTAGPFALDDHRPKSHRPATVARFGTPEYHAYWSAFAKGRAGQSAPGAEHDETITRYLRAGYRLGCLVNWKPPKDSR